MKYFLTLSYLMMFGTLFSQTLNDIATTQNIQHVQSAAFHWANGATFYDYDEDGWDDLVLPVDNDSLVFYKNINGNLVKIPSYIYAPGKVRQITWVDFDNNNTLDLVLTFHDIGIRLYSNDGTFSFTDVTLSMGVSTLPFTAYGVAFADPDTDGDLDFYICAYETVQVNGPNASHNLYYKNESNQYFSEVGIALGIDNGAHPSFMPVWFDFDNDGDLDLHVINDREYSGNALYQNNNGVYTEIANAMGVENYGHNPMSISISDFDNDSDFDIFESDVATGTIVNGSLVDYRLFENQGGSNGFINTAQSIGVDTNLFAWGGLWVDYDNDCFEDLYVATSFTDSFAINERASVFYRNNGGIDFSSINDSIFGDIVCSSYCPIKGDLNNDGFYDIIVLNDGVPPNVFLNSGNNNNHIKITLEGTISNVNAISAVIEVYANGQHQTQQRFCGDGICAQNSQHKIFGIGSSNIVDSLVVTFPSGIIVTKYSLAANMNYTIKESTTVQIPIIPNIDTLQVCAGDTVEIGNLGYFNYLWSNGSSNATLQVTVSGNYSFQAENLIGDTTFQSYELYVNFNNPLAYQEIIINASCGGTIDGIAQIDLTQPQLLDSIIWSDGSSSLTNSNLTPGSYNYTIVSIYGCTQFDSVMINSIPIFSTQFITSPATDNNGGSIQIFTWGGTQPFNYIMDGITVNDYVQNLPPGPNEIIVTDSTGCSDTIQFIINDETSAGINELLDINYNIYVADGHLFVCSANTNIQPSKVNVFDMSGKKMLDNEWNQKDVNCIYRTCDLPTGIYLVKIEEETSSVSKTILIR